MGITGIGTERTYIYNSQTGKISSKDGSADEFVDYFNGKLSGEDSTTLNGYDRANRTGIKNVVEWAYALGGCQGRKPWLSSDVTECEITCKIVSGEEFVYAVNGEHIMTCYAPSMPMPDEIASWGRDLPFKTRQSKAYDSATNSMNFAVGDVFDLGRGYRLRIGEDHVEAEGYGNGSAADDERLRHLEYGLNALVHFADQQRPASCIWSQHMPMLLSLLKELGIDTSREFTLNETKCVVNDGKIEEAGNKWCIPSSAHERLLKRDEELLSRPLSAQK